MKTLKEFDYDLWAIEENGRKRYFARIKATGEETEVSLEVMRLLLRQEKQMRREYAKQQTMLMCGLKENKAYCKPIIKHCNRKQPLQEKKQGKKHRRKRKRKATKWSYNSNIFL